MKASNKLNQIDPAGSSDARRMFCASRCSIFKSKTLPIGGVLCVWESEFPTLDRVPGQSAQAGRDGINRVNLTSSPFYSPYVFTG